MRVLVFDPFVEGHHVEYLRHLADFTQRAEGLDLHMAVHPRFHELAPDVHDIATDSAKVHIHLLTMNEFEGITTAGLWKRALIGWEAMEQRARAVDADMTVFLEMNLYQPVFGMPKARTVPFQTSGILFFPFTRLEATGEGMAKRLRVSATRLRKRLQTRWVLSNPTISSIFVLNDPWSATQLNQSFQRNVFHSLPDPIAFEPESVEGTEDEKDWAMHHWACGDRTHFLIFGSLREDKGVVQALEAFRCLSNEEASGASLHILGKSRDDFREPLRVHVSALRDVQPALHVHIEDRYLSEAEIKLSLDVSDVVLAPYQRTEGSSGVIGHAAQNQTPVIGPETGLIGQLIQAYQMGQTVDASSPQEIGSAIRKSLQSGHPVGDLALMKQYVEERSPDAFARAFFDRLS